MVFLPAHSGFRCRWLPLLVIAHAAATSASAAPCPGQHSSRCIMADNFVPNSHGRTVVATQEMEAILLGLIPSLRTSANEGREKIAFIVSDDSGLSVKPGGDVQTGFGPNTRWASAVPPAGSKAVAHSHINGTTNFVSPEDAAPLKAGLLNAVVSDDRIGVYEIVNGRLRFRMLEGRMESAERRDQQEMLNKQQLDFDIK